ncbi:MAG TPA: aminodeoxychorismate/anthranilate synthase component II [Clostridiales bacterium]|nr:aminodeoxychorismate/anthranilate synthase component II [Clostridiales bacterium]
MILMVDNIDSFVWNLIRYLELAGARTEVVRNDQLDLDQIGKAGYHGIVLSPGPGTPSAAGRMPDLLQRFAGRLPILGVCLGHQAIAEHFGARIITGLQPMHGKLSQVTHDGQGIFRGLPSPLTVTRYHSLAVDRASLPDCLTVSSQTADGCIMGLRHRSGLLESVQFHPEAELTEYGRDIIMNFVDYCREYSDVQV